jgi:peptidoglycan/LPS O-acetylase OafA/YrhL
MATMTARIGGRTGYLPSLDGWRALAIVGVLFAHDLPWSIWGFSNGLLLALGGFGVNLFFAISGILITTRILEEERACGAFNIKGFYLRRICRIQPAAMAYLVVIGLLMLFRVIEGRWSYWLAGLLMYENFVWHPSTVPFSLYEGHFWSLAVEEHFYILLSVILFFVLRRRLAWMIALYAVFFTIHSFALSHGLFDPVATGRRTYWQIDFLLFPAILAVALQRPKVRDWAMRYWKPWLAFAVTLAAAVLHRLSVALRQPGTHALTPHEWINEMGLLAQFFFALWVAASMLHGSSWTTRVLELAPLRFVGKISYSLYLWHILFFFRAGPNHITNPVLLALSGERIKFVAAFAVAALSYYLLERPMMRLGHRLAPPAQPGRKDLGLETSKACLPDEDGPVAA